VDLRRRAERDLRVDGLRTGVERAVPPGVLAAHLDALLGGWPPTGAFDVVGSVHRQQPGWDGRICPALSLTGAGGTVLSVPPDRVADVSARVRDKGAAEVLGDLGGAVGRRSMRTVRWTFRWCTAPAALPEAGSWFPAEDSRLPDWLHPFGGEALAAFDHAGTLLGAVGIKRHHGGGAELAVVTERRARGRGLGQRLVAQAARRVLDEGKVPTYLNVPDNIPSARLADAVGFLDSGWTQRAALPPRPVRARLQRLAGRR
jgi:GNAT superfamily N-acetyltransferase